ncbi:ABC transporter permease [Halarcobacter anaerophilus]|jgi:putative ABC transport system permease protein|uniref:ABC transporter permease n=1 Tax=Halarcobacter anaerophilus TaxID=877500 RepID=A0A4Q0Y1X1_9BACT|nr:ABC transporter permease [Halarcobacter anaerophilus]QDF27654.1 UPF0014 domain-containing membrane protein, putative permease [Halarcobacter anaerophilus]RXJ64002.1 hypothetical protein CRV06_03405 [Halarcobacter anaerophilus]
MQSISFYNLCITLIPLIIVWYYYKKWTNNSKEIIVSTLRMVIQLLLIGYLLIFIFENKHIYLGIFIVGFMIVVSSFITIRNTKEKTKKHFFEIFLSIMIAGVVNLIVIMLVLDLEYNYEPRYIIPLAGMVFANTMNALSLAIERFEKEILRAESFEKAREISFKACLIPQVNAFLAVGLVSLPGMMTGQILSGIDPLIAVRYQIMIMTMTLSSAGLSSIIYFTLKQRSFNTTC